MSLPGYAAAPEEPPSASAEGAVGAPSAAAEGILPLSPLALNPEPLTSSTQLNPKKGAGMYSFGGVDEALNSARLSWTYNWWHTLSFVRTSDTPSACCCEVKGWSSLNEEVHCLAMKGDAMRGDRFLPVLVHQVLALPQQSDLG